MDNEHGNVRAVSSQRVWWVNQGQHFKVDREAGMITAPTHDKRSRPVSHWDSVSQVRPGDTVVHYAKGEIVSVSHAIGEPRIERRRRSGEDEDHDAHVVDLAYVDLQQPIPLNTIPSKLRIDEDGPFDRNGSVKQGYLFELSGPFVEALAEVSPELPGLLGRVGRSLVDRMLMKFLDAIAKREGLGTPKDAAQWLIYGGKNNEIKEVRQDFLSELRAALSDRPIDVDRIKIACRNRSLLSGGPFPARLTTFLDHDDTAAVLEDLLGSGDTPPEVATIEAFIEQAIHMGFSTPQGTPSQSSSGLLASIFLTAAYPDQFVDYRFIRWKALAHVFKIPLPESKLSYGNALLWAAETARTVWETETFQECFPTDIPANWIVAGLAQMLHGSEKDTLNRLKGTDAMTPESDTPMALNQILYGPPGTGKTYQSIRQAVAICDGEAASDENVVERFKELKAENRIAFVTFHQSYGYEEFVEGIRPVLLDEEAEDTETSTVTYECRPGIFKKMCAFAKNRRTEVTTDYDIDLGDVTIWKMSLGNTNDPTQASIYDECLDGGYVLLGYGLNQDFTGCETRDAVLEKVRSADPEVTRTDYNVTAPNLLKNEMKAGDLIVVSDGNRKFRAIARITGDYEFIPDRQDYDQKRGVEWIRVFDESLPRELILKKHLSQMSLYNLSPKHLKIDALRELLSESTSDAPANHVLIIDEINRGNVSKILGELITLLEPDKRLDAPNELTVTLPYSGDDDFGLPSNLYIIGTMNTADRSIAFIDTALRRRFEFKEMMPDAKLVCDLVGENGLVDGVDVAGLLETLNQRIYALYDRDHQIGHSYLLKVKTLADLRDVFLENIIPLLQEYFYEDWSRLCTILGCPYDSETGDPTVDNEHPIIGIEKLRTIHDGDDELRFRHDIHEAFCKATESELPAFFEGIVRGEA